MDYQYVDGRLHVRRTDEEKKPILQRLKRIEGQVRGLQAMVQEDRYCLDEVQQMNAITAAVREAVLQLISSHLDASVDYAAKSDDR
ncbi:metal-sensitive transcriptional regulator [Methylobacterium ajmalii]|jgi:DNA-binding FrmR family transcriptional regulator|uniref:metal-sensitive transcriptional regulator n=1 Tax=Methylobacterium ajmalii TaxID=2738439 RepID=UPI00190DD905|nr:metal-sensitive transcriptional regulator [Methylobacterium ajmalii]MBK3399575.1 metal-sensitive transcriptional regulator [Methylobacterium ajmalii]MBK3408546.1 metal-sensitive transcriptional regulator [Methylobacterium ajmalii]MBK3422069.1 metal-sensitive transcriptional regulator [Methylobacterium ajmalii]MBZ6413258.1 metal-sensitive transcriptional regulator [Methylobacterium sp.]